MGILIRKPGILSTVQDLGRIGYRRLGINPNGVMDTNAVRLINILLGNEENAAVIEMHFPAAEIEFEHDAMFAVGGADFGVRLNGETFSNWRVHRAAKGSSLNFQNKLRGERAYLAIGGGFFVENWLGSSSTNMNAKIGGMNGRKLETGDRIGLASDQTRPEMLVNKEISPSLISRNSRFPTVRVIKGGEFDLLNEESRDIFEISTFQISNNSNRMGYRLNGEPLALSKPTEMLSSAANFGTIQLLPNGQLIILMADHQTTGGYPRIAHVISYDLPLLAQVGANDKVAFHLIDVTEAERITTSFHRDLNFLKTGVRLCSRNISVE